MCSQDNGNKLLLEGGLSVVEFDMPYFERRRLLVTGRSHGGFP